VEREEQLNRNREKGERKQNGENICALRENNITQELRKKKNINTNM
jgi:hypothetical protein